MIGWPAIVGMVFQEIAMPRPSFQRMLDSSNSDGATAEKRVFLERSFRRGVGLGTWHSWTLLVRV